jgi:hypothetical protein
MNAEDAVRGRGDWESAGAMRARPSFRFEIHLVEGLEGDALARRQTEVLRDVMLWLAERSDPSAAVDQEREETVTPTTPQ